MAFAKGKGVFLYEGNWETAIVDASGSAPSQLFRAPTGTFAGSVRVGSAAPAPLLAIAAEGTPAYAYHLPTVRERAQGVEVVEVVEGSPAALAGLRAEEAASLELPDLHFGRGPFGKIHVRFGKGARTSAPRPRWGPMLDGLDLVLHWFADDVRGKFPDSPVLFSDVGRRPAGQIEPTVLLTALAGKTPVLVKIAPDLTDDEVRRIVDVSHQEVVSVLEQNRGKLDTLVSALLEHETLDEDDAYAAAGVPRTATTSGDSLAAAARSRISPDG